MNRYKSDLDRNALLILIFSLVRLGHKENSIRDGSDGDTRAYSTEKIATALDPGDAIYLL